MTSVFANHHHAKEYNTKVIKWILFRFGIDVCTRTNLMEDEPVTNYVITASSKMDNIENVLSEEDDLVWQPDEDDQMPELAVTMPDEDRLISEVNLIGQYKEFVIKIGNKAGETLLDDEVIV